MNKALEYFLSETEMATAIDLPDRGIDLVYELTPGDWEQLVAAWTERSTAWREALAYFAGLADLEDSMPLLHLALFDSDTNIHFEAALSIADAILDGDEYELSDEQRNRLLELADSPMGQDFEELVELAQRWKK